MFNITCINNIYNFNNKIIINNNNNNNNNNLKELEA